ncbi:MAG TPA: lysylphosphatidylglycerol synthase transmembrane domain-containing protein [Candidatus Brocadiaceae bacterium]|nr:lysylphosphatidylglycerol synthase transmembrane domain-containing protein [Candidatus Brocadiaceae bacterium]
MITFNKKNITFLFSMVISIVCLWLFIRHIEWSLLKKALMEANYWFVIPTILLHLLVYLIRALRWKGLLSHIKMIPTLNLLSITCIGFMANNILPARVGEVLRPFLLYKKESVKFSTSVATVIVERIFDMLALIIFTAVTIALLPDYSGHIHNSFSQWPTQERTDFGESVILSLKKWTEVFAVVGVLMIIALFLIVTKPDFFKKILAKPMFFLSHTLKDKVFAFYDSFVHGLKILENRTETFWILGYSLLIWIICGAEIYTLGFSFHLQLPFLGACLVAICLALAIALPQAPGFIGVFHIAVLKSMDIFGIHTPAAQSYAIVLWLVGILPITIIGFLFLWKEGITFHEVVKLEEEIVDGKLEELEGIPKDTDATEPQILRAPGDTP